MTVHIHIYQGPDGPVQPSKPLQKPPAPNLVQRPSLKPPPVQATQRQQQAVDEARKAQGLLLALARQLTGDGDRLGARLKESLEALGTGKTTDQIMACILHTKEVADPPQQAGG